MARSYRKPMMNVEKFVANEYVAACGDENKVYKFKCDAGGGIKGDVWTDDGTNLTPGHEYYYHACSKTHDASTEDDFIYGYFYENGGNDKKTRWIPFVGESEYPRTRVIIWTEGGTNVHCTTNLNMDSWVIAKS